jgi:tRNA G18 (ribose-2'-O)-methylase SpoU
VEDDRSGTHGATKGPIVVVEDPEDPRLDLYRRLGDSSHRMRMDSEQSVFVVEGKLALRRLLSSEYEVRSLLVDDHQLTSAGDLVAATRRQGATVFVASRDVLATTVGFALHRGVVALADRPTPVDPKEALARVMATSTGTPLVTVLEGLNDHENIGAVFRNAAAFGVAGIFLDDSCADPLYRRAVRVSVGHVLHVPYARFTNWPEGLQDLRRVGLLIAALTPHPPDNGTTPLVNLSELGKLTTNTGVAILLGSEGPGLSSAALTACDVAVSIPMATGVDSLNVATAAAVAFYALTEG